MSQGAPPAGSGGQVTPSPDVLPTGFLTAAVQRLRSEILIYLLAYAVLVVVVLLWGQDLSLGIQGLLYLLPLVGVAAYLISQSRRVTRGRLPKVSVGALFTGKGATVQGLSAPGFQGDVKVSAGLTRGTVSGIGSPVTESTVPAQGTYLQELFANLGAAERHEVIELAQRLHRRSR